MLRQLCYRIVLNMKVKLHSAIPYLIHRNSRLLRQNLISILENNPWEVSPEQYFLIIRLSEKDGLSMTELADPYLKDLPNIHRMVKGMIQSGLVKKTHDLEDKRTVHIWLTDKGRSAAKSFSGLREKKIEELLKGFSAKDIKTFSQMLLKFQDNLLE